MRIFAILLTHLLLLAETAKHSIESINDNGLIMTTDDVIFLANANLDNQFSLHSMDQKTHFGILTPVEEPNYAARFCISQRLPVVLAREAGRRR